MSDIPAYGTVYFNDQPFPVRPTTGYANLGQFARKQTFGDYTRDSDEVLSSKIWTDLTGGLGVDTIREGADEGRSWFATVDTTRPYQWALWPAVTQVSTAVYPLGDLTIGTTTTMYFASNTALYSWDETNDVLSASLDTLANPPVYKGVAFNGKLFVPQGANGYYAWDGAAGTEYAGSATVPKAIGFVEYDNALFALGSDGVLMRTTDGTTWTVEVALNTSLIPRRIVLYMNRQEEETIYLVTDRQVFAWDPPAGTLIPTRLKFPPHPDNGLGAAHWRLGEDLYVSAGVQAYRWNLSSILPMGPDRRDGLPDALRGRIVDLEPEHNLLLALVEGVSVVTTGDPAIMFDDGGILDDPITIPGTEAQSALLGYNGFGWHCLWQSGVASGSGAWTVVSSASSAYRIWWGWGGSCWTMPLSRAFSNPRQRVATGEGTFGRAGEIDLGWFTANMVEFDKIASHVEVSAETMPDLASVALDYKVNVADADWVNAGSITGTGRTTVPIGWEQQADGHYFATGCPFRRIRFRLRFDTTGSPDATSTPIIDSLVFKFIKTPLSTESYTLSIPLDFTEWNGRTPASIKEELRQLLISPEFVRVKVGGGDAQFSRRMRLTSINGTNATGDDDAADRQVALVEVPLPGFEGNDAVFFSEAEV